jgi:hypothetical protein
MKEQRLLRKTRLQVKCGPCSPGTRLINCLDSPTMQIFEGSQKCL